MNDGSTPASEPPVLKVFLGGPNECGTYLSDLNQHLDSIRPYVIGRFDLQHFYWNARTLRTIGDGVNNPQRRIDASTVNPSNCDLMIMLFDGVLGTAPPEGDPAYGHPSWSAYEIETALSRQSPPHILLLRNDRRANFNPPKELTEAQLDELWAREKERLRFAKALETYLDMLRARDISVQELDFNTQLAETAPPVISEVLHNLAAKKAAPIKLSTATSVRFEGYPFRGSEELGPADGDIFFGRQAEVTELLTRLRSSRASFQVIQGPSGVGKSSLLGAGLLFQILHRGALGEGRIWSYTLFRPGASGRNPFAALAADLQTVFPGQPGGVPPRGDRDALAQALHKACLDSIDTAYEAIERVLFGSLPPGETHNLILAINQFEELWTVANSYVEPFMNFVAAAQRHPKTVVIATIRDDHLANFVNAEQVVPIFQQPEPVLFPLSGATASQISEIIRGPAEIPGVSINFGKGFIETITTDTLNLGDTALPLLCLLLHALWSARGVEDLAATFTLEDYQRLGGLEGIVAALSRRAADEVNPDMLKLLFDQLVQMHDGRPVMLNAAKRDLLAIDLSIEGLVERLVAERLLHASGVGDRPTLRIAHEALATHWIELRQWIAQNEHHLSMRDEISREAEIWWKRGRRETDIKLGRGRLQELQERMRSRPRFLAGDSHLQAYVKSAQIEVERANLVSAVKGGHITAAVSALRRLKSFGAHPILPLSYRGGEPHELAPALFAAITGDDRPENDLFSSYPLHNGAPTPTESFFESIEGAKALTSITSRGRTPVAWAIIAGHSRLVRRLHARGANCQWVSENGANLLTDAACGGDLPTFRFLVEEVELDPTLASLDGDFPILWAVQERRAEIRTYLQARGQSLEFRTKDGWSPLTEAARADDADLVRELLNCSEFYSLDDVTADGQTILHVACGSDRVKTAEVTTLLIEELKIDVFLKTKTESTALHLAAQRGNQAALDILIAAAARDGAGERLLEMQDANGMTALHIAIYENQPVAAEVLLRAGADTDRLDNSGTPALTYAITKGHRQCAQLLLDWRASTQPSRSDKWSALHHAADCADLDLVERVIQKQPHEELDCPTPDGWTAVMLAALHGRVDVVEALLAAGASPSFRLKSGRDALHIADARGHRDVVACLKTWGEGRPDMADSLRRQSERERQRAARETLSIGASCGVADTFSSEVGTTVSSSRQLIDDMAAARTDIEKGKLLRQADPKMKGQALIGAASAGQQDLVTLFMSDAISQADLTSAATAAAEASHLEIAKTLIASGASVPDLWLRPRVSNQLPFLNFTDRTNDSALKSILGREIPILHADDNELWQIRSSPLPFLSDHNLISISCDEVPGPNEDFYLQSTTQGLLAIDWTNEPIYKAIERGIFKTDSERLAYYVRFFFTMVRGQLGRFQITELVDEIRWSRRPGAKKLKTIGSKLIPLQAVSRSNDVAIFRGTVVFRNAIFMTDMLVSLKKQDLPSEDGEGTEHFTIGQLRLQNEELLFENLPIIDPGPPHRFG